MAVCGMKAISSQRRSCRSDGVSAARSRPSNSTVPDSTVAWSGRSPRIAFAVVDFPEADSPESA